VLIAEEFRMLGKYGLGQGLRCSGRERRHRRLCRRFPEQVMELNIQAEWRRGGNAVFVFLKAWHGVSFSFSVV
jgi:hypothetical protein